jgi:hypothetical protein
MAIFVFPLIFIPWVICLSILAYPIYEWLIPEDHPIENLEFLFFFLSFAVALFMGVRFFKTRNNLLGLLYLIFAFGLFLIAMEEISWGQRIFGLVNPTYFEQNNLQKETNIHNLNWDLSTLSYIPAGFIGAFAWLMLPARIKAKYRSIVDFLVPKWYLTFYFLPIFIISVYYIICQDLLLGCSYYLRNPIFLGTFHRNNLFVYARLDEQEPAEFLLALGFLLFLIINVYRQSFGNRSGPLRTADDK